MASIGCGGGGGSNAPDAALAADAGPDAAPVVQVLINEIVTDPANDWSHSDGVGEPFVGLPGAGDVSPSDEYIELYNAGTATVDLTGWTLEIVQESPVTAALAEAGAVVRVSAGSTLQALQPGAFVLLGDPPGVLSNDVFLVLRDAQGAIMDDVEIGGLSPSRNFEGGDDPVNDGAPGPDQNGFATGSFDEAVARPDGRPDTDDDQADFDRAYATPLTRNRLPAPPSETQPPVVMATPSGTGYPVTQPLRVEFSEPIAAASLLANFTVTAGGQPIPLGFATFEARDRVVNINPVGRLPYGQQIQVTLRGGAEGIKDLAGNALAADVSFSVTTEAAAANPAPVVLNEICAAPVQDWDDTAGGDGEPFSTQVGTGLASSDDEWVELYVREGAAGAVDLSGYTLVIFNGPNLSTLPRVVTPVEQASGVAIRIIGAGTALDALSAGDRVIIGNPRGAILADSVIELRDSAGRLIDAVEIGGNTVQTDRGGDGVANGAPDPGSRGGLSTGLADETIARSPDGADTGTDVDDFSYAAATLGAANP